MSWISPTSHNDPESKWGQETYAYDGNTGTAAQDTQTGGTWGPWLELSFSAEKACSGGRLWAEFDALHVDSVQIQVNDSSLGWTTTYSGAFNDLAWTPWSFSYLYNFTTARVRFFSITTQNANFHELAFWEYVEPTDISGDAAAIYAGTGQVEGRLFRWKTGESVWTQLAGQYGSEVIIHSLAHLDGRLYGGTKGTGLLLGYVSGTGWVLMAGQLNSQIEIWAQTVFNGILYGGASNGGRLFKFDSTEKFPFDAWVQVAPQSGSEIQIYSITVFNGKLYAGTSPGAKTIRVERHRRLG